MSHRTTYVWIAYRITIDVVVFRRWVKGVTESTLVRVSSAADGPFIADTGTVMRQLPSLLLWQLKMAVVWLVVAFTLRMLAPRLSRWVVLLVRRMMK